MRFNYSADLVAQAMTYDQYLGHIRRELALNANGDLNAERLKEDTRQNLVYMQQTYDGTVVWDQITAALEKAPATTWLVLTEGASADAARSAPLFQKIAEASRGKVAVRFLLRDRNPDLMDRHLTDGRPSIPKLIVLDENLAELASWGPRPAELQAQMKEWRSEPGLNPAEFVRRLTAWYDGDDTDTAQEEMVALVERYS